MPTAPTLWRPALSIAPLTAGTRVALPALRPASQGDGMDGPGNRVADARPSAGAGLADAALASASATPATGPAATGNGYRRRVDIAATLSPAAARHIGQTPDLSVHA